MQLSDLDGFLTGIVVGPEQIMPSEWLPVVWGDDPPEFANEELAQSILGTIMGRYNEIVQSLAADPPEFVPIFWQTHDGLVIARDWAEGFMEAIKLRPVEWRDMLNDDDAGLPLAPILMLVEDEEADTDAVGGADGQARLRMDATDLIPSCVIEIDVFWKALRRPDANTASTLH